MQVVDHHVEPKFKPLALVMETKEEYDLLARLLWQTSNNMNWLPSNRVVFRGWHEAMKGQR